MSQTLKELANWRRYHQFLKAKRTIKKPGWAHRLAPKVIALLKASTVAVVLISSCQQMPAWTEEIRYGTASYYTVESCLREGTSGIMANREVFDDKEMVCASWDFPFETRLKVTNLANEKSVIVAVKDRGPARRLYKKGRIIDLSKSAFMEIANIKQGIAKIQIEVVKKKK